MKDAIGILDMGIEGFSIVETLSNNFKHERFIYINDLKNYPYRDRVNHEVIELVKAKVKILIDENIKLLIVASDVIVDYCSEYLDTLEIPVINIVTVLTEYVNINYEQKNMVLFAHSKIIDANIYQKNFKYNRLYNIPSNELDEIIQNKMIKTSTSFHTTKDTFRNVNKDIDIIITSSPYLLNLKTEISEYLNFNEITDAGEILSDKIKEDFYYLNEKGKSEVLVFSNVPKKSFEELTYWSELKYKYTNYDLNSINKR